MRGLRWAAGAATILLICIIPGPIGAHGVNAACTSSDLATHQAKGEVMPFFECVSILNSAPKKENLFALVKRDLVFVRDWPSDVDVEAHISERNTRNAALRPGKIIKGDIFQDINLDVRFDGQIVSWSLPIISQFGMRNERVSAFFEWIDRSFHAMDAYVGAQLPFGGSVGKFNGRLGGIGGPSRGIDVSFAGDKKADCCSNQKSVEENQQPISEVVRENVVPLAFLFTFCCMLGSIFVGGRTSIFGVAMFGYGWLLLIVAAELFR